MALEVRGIDVAYGHKQVIHRASLTGETGRIVALVGHNGAGKTTVLRAIMGLLPLKGGEVLLDGQRANHWSTGEIIRHGLAYCPQGGEVFKTLSIQENLDLAAFHLGDTRKEAKLRDLVFDLFPILKERRGAHAGTLSGGERQQLVIGMGLMTAPTLLLLDEPSGGLAPLMVEKVFQVIRQINQESGLAILVVEQNLVQAFGVAQEIYVLRSGQVVYGGESAALDRDESARQAILGF